MSDKKLKNLYRVKCRGTEMSAYVVATDPSTAYDIFKAYLDQKDLGFFSERVLESVTLLSAERGMKSTKDVFLLQETP